MHCALVGATLPLNKRRGNIRYWRKWACASKQMNQARRKNKAVFMWSLHRRFFNFEFSPCQTHNTNTQTVPVLLMRPRWWEEHVLCAPLMLCLCYTCVWLPACRHNRSCETFCFHSLGSIQVLRQLTWEMRVNMRQARRSGSSASISLICHPSRLLIPPICVW